ncbi:helix-hairpin-helix domain-containing protein [Calderihabitans maritimus]|uniref:Competence protein ComEA n=1 Tax=Calderihabitans maritimus TaxID=1246530 RepID=A0A1Z5HS97_9FIRM|nr:helix-hairpin-helix domain-containing protein [Calderihabitans maritimus]GAW92392.1 competence protein ComEA [Calderihabitans maritimus]
MKNPSVPVAVWIIIAALFFGIGIKYAQLKTFQGPPTVVNSIAAQTPGDEKPQEIQVHVIGAVRNPGVYVMGPSSRVKDAVEKAVPLPDADLDQLNLAAKIKDGQQIVVPRIGESTGELTESYGSTSSGANQSRKININTAGVEELDQLPGIGKVYAQRIVDYREENGKFQSIEDIQKVSGIGPATFAKIKDLITVK